MGPSPAPDATRDPGLQPERTRLAWRRTTLTYTVVAVLAGRQVVRDEVTAAGIVAAALSALVWLGFLGVAHRRMVALDRAIPRALPVGVGVAVVVCVLCLAGFGVSVL